MAFKFDQEVKALDLERYLGKVQNRIALVGIELEGGWNHLSIPAGTRPERDGSVFKNQTPDYLMKHNVDLFGEIASPVMMPAQAAGWMRKFYPLFVDNTCGLHIHMSWETPKPYASLMVPEFPVTMLEYMKRWATEEALPKENTLWGRLDDQSVYCQHKFWPDEQVKLSKRGGAEYYDQKRKGSRYTVINYCYKLHGTIECRLLPMFEDKEVGVRGIRRIMDITNAAVVALAKRDERVKGQVFSLTDDCEEHYEVRV